MHDKKFLPVWTDGLTYDEQHLAYWIADNMERVTQDYSLLPIRLEGDSFCERKHFDNYVHLIEDYFEKGTCRMRSKIVPLSYYVAEKAFDLAAEELFHMYPNTLKLSFHKLNDNGVYDTKFDVDYATRLDLFRKILNKKIDELCIVDEVFEFQREETKSHIVWPEYSVNALLDIKEEDIYYNFPKFLSSYGYPYIAKNQVKVKKEDIYRYFKTIPENILILGNQYIKYNENAEEYSEFFKAAKNGDLDTIISYIRDGVNINTIDSDGKTVFAKYIDSSFDPEKGRSNIEDLKTLIRLGANPAIYGVGDFDSPLDNACLYESIDLVLLLLENNVSPHLYPCIDEPYENMSETLLERTERWAEGDLNISLPPSETQSTILDMLKKHA